MVTLCHTLVCSLILFSASRAAAEPKGTVKITATDNEGFAKYSYTIYRYRQQKQGDVLKDVLEYVAGATNLRSTTISKPDIRTLRAGRYRVSIRSATARSSSLHEYINILDGSRIALSANLAKSTIGSFDRGDDRTSPDVELVTDQHLKDLSLPNGLQGVFVKKGFDGLPDNIVVESVFHRAVSSIEDFWMKWNRYRRSGQVLIGLWNRDSDNVWRRKYRMVAFDPTESDGRQISRFRNALKEVGDDHRNTIQSHMQRRAALNKQLASIVTNAEEFDPSEFSDQVVRIKAAYTDAVRSPKFLAARKQIVDKFNEAAPVAQKILLRTVTNAAKDRDKLVVDLAKATITGGTAVGPLAVEYTLDASLDVFVEEGILTQQQANAARGASYLVQGLNGIQKADDALSVIDAINDTYSGVVEISNVKKDAQKGHIEAELRAGKQVIEFLIVLASD